ncbi:MAG: SDR family oxidoreductase [Lysobacterales bacterium]
MQRVLVTGANRGLGLEFVKRYLGRGARVFAVVRRITADAPWKELAERHPGQLSVLTLDLADSAAFAGFAQRLAGLTPALDVLINNAGILASGERLGALDGDRLVESFRINALAPLLLTQALTPLLLAGTAPRVAMLSSELASIGLRQRFGTPSYSISKAALNMATRLLALELGPRGIGCVALHPGWVRTDMGGEQAPLTVEQAVPPLIERIDQIKPEQHGGFYSADGSALPW